MSDVIEIFGKSTGLRRQANWKAIVSREWCPYLDRKCIKVRKSRPDTSIGTCSVLYGREKRPIIICPFRLLERRQIFIDCLHLLSLHEPGNELHIVPEMSVPGGSVDYFIASAYDRKVIDFVGVELQTVDTTGTVWPARQRCLQDMGVDVVAKEAESSKTYGMNWKMTAKTTLIQLHHKVRTFEDLGKHLVLVIQDRLLDYLRGQFQFSHLKAARTGHPMHFHSYEIGRQSGGSYRLALHERLSTDSAGIATCLGLQADSNVELGRIIQQLEAKISETTLFRLT
jgi:hypothetical protein